MNGELRIWTFFGHWENDELVIEYGVEGEVEDTRVDCGHWEQGLWAASASGRTVEEAEAAVRTEYGGKGDHEGDVAPWRSATQETAARRISCGLPYLDS